MPFYRYECEACGAIFKKLVMDGNASFVFCPECGSQATHRLVPRVGVLYKGKGYYATDYEKKHSPSEEKTSSCEEDEK